MAEIFLKINGVEQNYKERDEINDTFRMMSVVYAKLMDALKVNSMIFKISRKNDDIFLDAHYA